MTLALNEQQLEILNEVRENLQNLVMSREDFVDGSDFICVQIRRAIARRHGITESTRLKDFPVEAQRQVNELSFAIHDALSGSTTVGTYINRLGLRLSAVKIFDVVAHLARLAWLDRMIETKVLA